MRAARRDPPTASWPRAIEKREEPDVRLSALSREAVLRLQRSAGNHVVAQVMSARRLGRSENTPVMNLEEPEETGEKRPREEETPAATTEATAEAKRPKRRAPGWECFREGAHADVWKPDGSDKWHFSYYRESGDYHIKGNKGNADAYERGFFNGTYRLTTRKKSRGGATKNANVETVKEGGEFYEWCEKNIVPLYA